VLSDDASRKARLGETAERVEGVIRNEVDPEEFGLHSYFNYRIVSELAELPEPAWA
jgi:hypothetical protein